MEWSIVGLNFLYAAFGVVLMFLAYRVIDWLTPQVDFLAVAIFIASIFVSIAIVIGGALN
jgi:energy-converting hydrogenase Eha subunit E